MYTEEQRVGFSKAVESLKKYRRADLLDENGNSILDDLYVDLLPGNIVLEKCMLDNTTFLVGRKGTGKSTIFLKLENEYRNKKGFLPCYIDVKTLFESSQSQPINLPYLTEYFSSGVLEKYLLERTFLQNILEVIYKEIDRKHQSIWEKVRTNILGNGKNEIKDCLEMLIKKINNNEALREVEIPTLQQSQKRIKFESQKSTSYESRRGVNSVGVNFDGVNLSGDLSASTNNAYNNGNEEESEFTDIFLKVFEIKKNIEQIKLLLKRMEIKHLIILLDDVSEIDKSALKVFIDTIVAPLNNWSDEFIKFKVAFYPNRMHYGDIDPGKIDVINLDFYNLYSEFDVNKMEENAIAFTKRLLENRFNYFTSGMEQYFDITKVSMEEYYQLLFKVSMNVPRIMGYILAYAYQSKIIYGNSISKLDIENAAQKYFEEKIDSFFKGSVYCLLSINERRSIEELKRLEKTLVERAKEIKKQIVTKELSGLLYNPNMPYSSHFYVYCELEKYLESLELNHFVTKYDEKTDRDGKAISIYCINYGLAMKNNIIWGKEQGSKYRKYFVERPFNYSKIILKQLSENKIIICSNEKCRKMFSEEDLNSGLKFTKMKCPECGAEVKVENKIDEEIEKMIDAVKSFTKVSEVEYRILIELFNAKDKHLYAKDISGEIDFSSRFIAERCKNLQEKYEFVIRDKTWSPYQYFLSEKGKKYILAIFEQE